MNPLSVAQISNAITIGRPDADNPVLRFLGPIAQSMEPTALDGVKNTNYDLPENYRNKNQVIRTVIEGLLMDNPNDFLTTVALPWARTDEMHFTWNEWHFDTPLVDRVPHEGISRLLQSSKMARNAHVVRRGIAFQMEADYYNSPEGERQFTLNVRQITKAVAETQNYDALFEIMTCKEYETIQMERFGRSMLSEQDLVQHEVDEYNIVSHGRDQFEMLIERHKESMRNRRHPPDMMIVWPQAAIYLTMADPVKTSYFAAGPGGVAIQKAGPDALARMRDLPVFASRAYDVYKDEAPVNLLLRPSEIGERYPMTARDFRNDDMRNYKSKWRSVAIYNQNSDSMQVVDFMTALRHARIFNANGTYHDDLRELVASYSSGSHMRAPDRARSGMDENNEDPHGSSFANHGGERGPGDEPPPFFMATVINRADRYELANYFGQLPLGSANDRDMQQVGESIVGKIVSESMDRDVETWMSFMDLVRRIEDQTYDHEYTRALIAANVAQSLGADGTAFVGEQAPGDVISAAFKGGRVRQWKSNAYGGLNLPRRTQLMGAAYPSGFANAPGFLTLAAEADKGAAGTDWYPLAARARDAVDMLQRLFHAIKKALPHSEALKADNRSAWWCKADPFTAFFETCVGVPRDPVFLAFLPPTERPANAGRSADSNGDSDGDAHIVQRAVPFLVYDVNPDGLTADKARALFSDQGVDTSQFRVTGGRTNESHEDVVYAYKSVVTGETVAIKRSSLTANVLGTEARLLRVLGAQSSQALVSMADQLDDARRRQLVRILFKLYSVHIKRDQEVNIRAVVLGLHTHSVSDDGTNKALIKAIDDIAPYLGDGRTAAARAALEEYIAEGSDAAVAESPNVSPANQIGDADAGEMVVDYATNAGPTGRQIADAHDAFTDAVNAINTARKARGPVDLAQINTASNNLMRDLTQTAFDIFTNLEDGDDAQKEIAAKNFAVFKDNVKNGRTQAARYGNGGKGREVDIDVRDDDRNVERAVFYRAPLTNSLAWLQSAAAVELPLVRPSDPNTGHTSFVVDVQDDNGSTAVPDYVWRRRQYATIDSGVTDDAKRSLQDMPFLAERVSRISASSIGARAKSGGSAGKRRRNAKKHRRNNKRNGQGNSKRRGRQSVRSTYGDDADVGQADMGSDADSEDDDSEDDDSEDDDDESGNNNNNYYGQKQSASVRGAVLRRQGINGQDDMFADTAIGATLPQHAPSWRDASADVTLRGLRDRDDASYDRRLPPTHFATAGKGNSDLERDFNSEVFIHRFKRAQSIPNGLVRAATLAFLMSRCDELRYYETMYAADAHIPINLILWRVGIEHEMYSVVLMKGGIDTGANLYGHSNFASSADVQSKMYYGNFTFYSKARVWQAKNVEIIPDVRSERYMGGNNASFVTDAKQLVTIRHRDRPSIIVTAVPITEDSFDQMMSFTGFVPFRARNSQIDGPQRPSYSQYEYYDRTVYRLGELNDTGKPQEKDDLYERSARRNVVAFQGLQVNVDRSTGTFTKLIDGKGHRKRNASGPGTAKVWNGADAVFPDYDAKAILRSIQ